MSDITYLDCILEFFSTDIKNGGGFPFADIVTRILQTIKDNWIEKIFSHFYEMSQDKILGLRDFREN